MTRLLLDTHVALWATMDSKRLRSGERLLLGEADEVVVSVATIWEIAIKHRLQRGHPDDMPVGGGEALAIFREAGYFLLAVAAEHAAAFDDLPLLHGDPFDRMLVAQALCEPMQLLTRDARLKDYGALVELA